MEITLLQLSLKIIQLGVVELHLPLRQDVYVSGCVHGRERKCKTFMKGGEEDDVARTLFETSAFGLVLILLMLSMPGS